MSIKYLSKVYKKLLNNKTLLSKSSHNCGFNNCNDNTYDQKKYLVEFKGLYKEFRSIEYIEVTKTILYKYNYNNYPIKLETAIIDSLDYNYSICLYTYLPNDLIAIEIAHRCSLIRSIIEVWGEGTEVNEVVEDLNDNIDSLIMPLFPSNLSYNNKSWKATFRRLGRGTKFDNDDKRITLDYFKDSLNHILGPVDMSDECKYELIYLEDWYSYQLDLRNNSSNNKPSKCYFGRVIANGLNIQTLYSLKDRPYIGSTTMNEFLSHIAISVSNLSVNSIVFDPYAGTGSILIAAAYLNCYVIGSDIDIDSLGLLKNQSTNNLINRSKNSKFKRKDSNRQLDKNIQSNFDYYNLSDRVIGWIGTDIANWMNTNQSLVCRINYDNYIRVQSHCRLNIDQSICINDVIETSTRDFDFKVDAIVTDPPFGRRERTYSLESMKLLYSDSIISTAQLFIFSCKKLKLSGKLVFWFPTTGSCNRNDVKDILDNIKQIAINMYTSQYQDCIEYNTDVEFINRLKLDIIIENKVHSGLSRWLCVYKVN